MIVRPEKGRLRLTMQTDHGLLAGTFADTWGGPLFSPPEPPAAVKIAADYHDHGWEAWEALPQVNPETGHPYDFMTIPPDQHVEIYERGIAQALERHPYAGLLVSLHGTGLYKQRYGYLPELVYRDVDPQYRDHVDQYLHRQEALQKRLMADLQPHEETMWTHYRWLQAWDLLSLFLCLSDPTERTSLSLGVMPLYPGGPEERVTVRGVGMNTYVVSPWPFAASELSLLIPVRYVPDRRYSGDADFCSTFDAAPTEALSVQILPAA